MRLKYDIFRRLPDEGPVWVESARDVEDAKDRMATLLKVNPGDYILYDLSICKIVLQLSSAA